MINATWVDINKQFLKININFLPYFQKIILKNIHIFLKISTKLLKKQCLNYRI